MIGAVTQRTVSAGSGNLPLLLVVGTTGVMLALRLAETQGDPLVYLRILCSLAALTIVIIGRRHLLRCALFAFALEAAGGVFTFVYVDIPFVNAHHAQIGALALAIHHRLAGSNPLQR